MTARMEARRRALRASILAWRADHADARGRVVWSRATRVGLARALGLSRRVAERVAAPIWSLRRRSR